jgi:hypothetical protein
MKKSHLLDLYVASGTPVVLFYWRGNRQKYPLNSRCCRLSLHTQNMIPATATDHIFFMFVNPQAAFN